MDDSELDSLLVRAAPVPSPAAVDAALVLARRTAVTHRRSSRGVSRWWRRPALVASLTGGGLLLVGAGTLSAYQLHIPPFQTTDSGTERLQNPVSISYISSLGRTVRCQAFTEWEHLTDPQRSVLAAMAADPFWRGYGDRVLATEHLQHAPVSEQQQAVFDALDGELRARAETALTHGPGAPGLAPMHGIAVSCAPGGSNGQ